MERGGDSEGDSESGLRAMSFEFRIHHPNKGYLLY